MLVQGLVLLLAVCRLLKSRWHVFRNVITKDCLNGEIFGERGPTQTEPRAVRFTTRYTLRVNQCAFLR